MEFEMFVVLTLLFCSTAIILLGFNKPPVWCNRNDGDLVNLLILQDTKETRTLSLNHSRLYSCKVHALVATAKKKFASVVTITISDLHVFVLILFELVNVSEGLYKDLKIKGGVLTLMV